MKRKLRILVLIDKSLIPPEKAAQEELDTAKWRTEFYVINTLKKSGHDVKVLGVEGDLRVIRKAKEEFKPHIAFNLLEAFDGESVFDHNVVSYLELIKLPYSGCNPKGLILARDKSLSKKILNYHRIRTPQFATARMGKKFKRSLKMKFPLIVKSLTEEGSCGISQNSIVNDDDKLQERIKFIHENTISDAIIESYIPGKDVYVSMLGNKKISIFPLLELVFENAPDSIHQIATGRVKWNPDYRKKYNIDVQFLNNSDPVLHKKITSTCKRIYRILHMTGYARIDLRVTDSGELFFIEANPNPEIAQYEEFAMSSEKSGLKYPELLNKILKLGLNWRPSQVIKI